MKKLVLIAAASLAALGSALAADLPSRKAAPAFVPPPPPPPLWSGFYAGLNIGGAWSANSVNPNSLAPYVNSVSGAVAVFPGNTSGGNTAGGVIGGGQIGYNYQTGAFLLGLEADIQGASLSSGGSNNWAVYPGPAGSVWFPVTNGGNNGASLTYLGTVRGRLGYLVTPTLLAYATGGFAYGGIQANFNGNTNNRTGWTVGGGAEWMFLPNWSAKLEYLYTNLSNTNGGYWVAATPTFVGNGQFGANRDPQFHTVRAGVNYHFNWAPAAPVVAKY